MRCSFCGAENIRTMEGVMRHHRRVLKRLSLLAGRRLVCRRVARYSVRSNSYVRAPEHVKPGRRVYMPDLYELTIERVEVTRG